MKRYTRNQIQEKLELLDLGHRVVFDGEYVYKHRIKMRCKECGHVWICNRDCAFVGCPHCYQPIGKSNKNMYVPGIKIGEWKLDHKTEDENGIQVWQCFNDKGDRMTFTQKQLKYIRENGEPSYGANIKNVNSM